MVSRSNTSKIIRRRTGGTGVKPTLTARQAMSGEVGSHKRTRVRDVNRPGDWIPNPKYKPGNPYSSEPPMIRNPATKNKKKKAARTKESEKIRLKAAKEKARKSRIARLQKETAAKADKGRTARKAATSAASMRGVAVPRKAAVEVTDIPEPENLTGRGRSRVNQNPIGRYVAEMQAAERAKKAIEKKPKNQNPIGRYVDKMQAAERAKKANEENPLTSEQIARLAAEQRKADNLFIEKKGGKLSRKKGGMTKKKYSKGGKVKKAHKQTNKTNGGLGNKFVAKLYD